MAMIESGSKVKFDYTLTVDGEKVDSSEGRKPLEYIHGKGMIIKGLESKMEGLKEGDEREFVIPPEEGYGLIRQDAFKEVPKDKLPLNVDVSVGQILQVKTPEGGSLPVSISEIKSNTVIVNLNHPLAGKELHFDVSIVEIK